jgi:hypothetical protein
MLFSASEWIYILALAFLAMVAVMIVAVRAKARPASPARSGYQIPPDIVVLQQRGRTKTHWMYDQKRR